MTLFLRVVSRVIGRISLRKAIWDPRFSIAAFILLVVAFFALFAPFLTAYSPYDSDISLRLLSPTEGHWLGCDLNGKDVWTSLIYGSRVSLYIGFASVAISMSLGVVLGLSSGYFGGWFDMAVMRLVDILMAFPGILLALVLTSVLGPSIHNIILAIVTTGWVSTARLVRGQVLSLREQDHVLSAISLGASTARILSLHLLPSILPFLVIQATFSLSGVILVESSLSFLGLGPQQGITTWGALLSQGKSVLTESPRLALVPGLAIMSVVLALNFFGDFLRDTWDPKATH